LNEEINKNKTKIDLFLHTSLLTMIEASHGIPRMRKQTSGRGERAGNI
jgi:hypothetical protein